MESGQKKGGFKVEDKRLFNPDGSDRDINPTKKTEATKEPAMPEPQTGQPLSEEEVTLSSFIMSLATQGMMQLGEMHAPDGFQVPVDLEHAKQTIDLIAMLNEKTKGNQDEFEQKLFEEVLYSLRMAFVRKKGGAA